MIPPRDDSSRQILRDIGDSHIRDERGEVFEIAGIRRGHDGAARGPWSYNYTANENRPRDVNRAMSVPQEGQSPNSSTTREVGLDARFD
jgi:hypothetical protein